MPRASLAGDVDVDLDGLTGLECQVQLLRRLLTLLLDLLFQSEGLEVVLQGHVEVEGVTAVGETQANVAESVGLDDEIPGIIAFL